MLSRSSVDALYRAVPNVVSKTCWVQNLRCELQLLPMKVTMVYYDNDGVVYFSTNPVQQIYRIVISLISRPDRTDLFMP